MGSRCTGNPHFAWFVMSTHAPMKRVKNPVLASGLAASPRLVGGDWWIHLPDNEHYSLPTSIFHPIENNIGADYPQDSAAFLEAPLSIIGAGS